MPSRWHDRTRSLTLALVQQPSVTDTPGERDFAPFLRDLLAKHPYFQAHPHDLWLERTQGDPRERYNLFALVRGSGARTVVLAGHYDVVSTANYTELEPWACDPEALLPRLREWLAANARSESDRKALEDLSGGEFLPGRGVLDMKSGIAAGLAVLLEHAEDPGRVGNLLLVATPDEENSSHGMRSAAARLRELAEGGLELVAALNLDATNDAGDGTLGRAAYLGSVGKLLPSVLVIGRETHAAYPLDGLGAAYLAAAITYRLEAHPDLADEAEGEVAPPPVCLQHLDLKTHYDVTTPGRAWCVYNQLSARRSPLEVLELWRRLVQEAVEGALEEWSRRQRVLLERAAALGHPLPAGPGWQVGVYTFAEVLQAAREHSGEGVVERLAALRDELFAQGGATPTQISRRLCEWAWDHSGLTGPAVVLAFGSLHYPIAALEPADPAHRLLRRVVEEEAGRMARETGLGFSVRPFFTGISDLSFLASADSAEGVAAMQANTPAFGPVWRFDFAGALRLPAVNIGPWGRDFHQFTERLHAPYAFEHLPELLWRVSRRLLAGG